MRANWLALMRKSKPKSLVLEGWKEIARFLGQPTSTAQRWAKEGMPVERKGRMVEAQPEKLNLWLGRVSHEPVQIATETPDLSAELKRGLAFVRRRRKPRPRI